MKLLEEFQNIFTDEELDYLFDYDLYDSIVNAEPYTLPKELSKKKKKNNHNRIKSILNPKATPAVLASSRGCSGCYVWLALQAWYASMHICGFFRYSCTASGKSSIVQV